MATKQLALVVRNRGDQAAAVHWFQKAVRYAYMCAQRPVWCTVGRVHNCVLHRLFVFGRSIPTRALQLTTALSRENGVSRTKVGVYTSGGYPLGGGPSWVLIAAYYYDPRDSLYSGSLLLSSDMVFRRGCGGKTWIRGSPPPKPAVCTDRVLWWREVPVELTTLRVRRKTAETRLLFSRRKGLLRACP